MYPEKNSLEGQISSGNKMHHSTESCSKERKSGQIILASLLCKWKHFLSCAFSARGRRKKARQFCMLTTPQRSPLDILFPRVSLKRLFRGGMRWEKGETNLPLWTASLHLYRTYPTACTMFLLHGLKGKRKIISTESLLTMKLSKAMKKKWKH